MRRAAVSAFGLSGTNVHIVLEEAPDDSSGEGRRVHRGMLPLIMSARDMPALRAQVTRLIEWWSTDATATVADVAEMLALKRTAFSQRIAWTFADDDDSRDAIKILRRSL